MCWAAETREISWTQSKQDTSECSCETELNPARYRWFLPLHIFLVQREDRLSSWLQINYPLASGQEALTGFPSVLKNFATVWCLLDLDAYNM